MIYISFLLLGLGAGAVYAALGTSIVLTYRSSGVINFAAGAVATYAAYVFATLQTSGEYFVPIPGVPNIPVSGGPLSLWPALILSLATAAALGLLLYWAIFRWLTNALPLAKLVASLGAMIVIEALIALRFGTATVLVSPIFPSGVFGSGELRLPKDRAFLTLTVIVIGIALWALSRFTRFGLTTRAAADSEKGALIIGISPHRVASLNWMIAALVTGLSGILISPIVPLTPGDYTLLIVPALAAALVGRLSALAPTVIAGLVIGALQSEVTKFQTFSWFPQSGFGDVIPVVLIIIVLFLRGRGIPQRGMLFSATLPLSPRPKAVLPTAAAGLVVLGVASALMQHQYRFGLMTSMTAAIIALSWVVVTGYVGQISLAQLSLAGVSAFMLSHFSAQWHVPFPLSVLASAAVATVVGIVIGLPALRIRGLNLAIVTLGAALALQSAWFLNDQFNGGVNGANVEDPRLFGLDLGIGSGSAYPRLAFALMIAVWVVLVGLLVASLRRSRLGSQMLAVRVNDRAAAAGGINVPMVKLAAFAIASFIAGVGGSLTGYQLGNVSEPSFDIFIGLSMFALAYLTGITSITGAMLAAVFFPGGIFYVVLSDWVSPSGYYSLITGILLIDAAIRNPEGFAGRLQQLGRGLGRKWGWRGSAQPDIPEAVVHESVPAADLTPGRSLITSSALADESGLSRAPASDRRSS